MPKELVIISGKGGTGKTSVTASFAVLAKSAVLADCDVDAADLHLLMQPKIIQKNAFTGGVSARIKRGHCTACGKCEEICRFDAIFFDGPGNGACPKTFRVDPIACEGCGVCAWFCAEEAIVLEPEVNGEWYVSETRCGPMVHARLGVAAENSGKLVTLVRNEARRIAAYRHKDFILIDGPPGIGCPVIASVTGASLALVVTEPTVSGEHDLERVLALTKHFSMPTAVCVNKWDLNWELTEQIECNARQAGARVIGRIRYDCAVTSAQMRELAVVETDTPAALDIRQIWDHLDL
jgi:MinD superfamily P-loop ATPase